MLLIAKIFFLFIAVWMSIVTVGRAYYKEQLPVANLVLNAVGITGFITCQWLV